MHSCILKALSLGHWVRLRRHFVCVSPVSRSCTQILSLFILAAILNKFALSLHKSVTWFCYICARELCQSLLSSGRHIGKREDPGDEVCKFLHRFHSISSDTTFRFIPHWRRICRCCCCLDCHTRSFDHSRSFCASHRNTRNIEFDYKLQRSKDMKQ